MKSYYVEACDFMARCDSAQFSLALRVLNVRIRMIRDKQTLEEIKKGLNESDFLEKNDLSYFGRSPRFILDSSKV